MKKRFLALLLSVCIGVSMLVLPASAAGSNTAVQTAVTLGAFSTEEAAGLSTPLTRGQLAKLLVHCSAAGLDERLYRWLLPPGSDRDAGRSLHRRSDPAGL